ncbi:hypothetical protein KM043_018429 [Ampulex compressa]|nr:hypothetical protein KM043_018429 [Ampulex compressa]
MRGCRHGPDKDDSFPSHESNFRCCQDRYVIDVVPRRRRERWTRLRGVSAKPLGSRVTVHTEIEIIRKFMENKTCICQYK